MELIHAAAYLPYELKFLKESRGTFIGDPNIKETVILTPRNIDSLYGKRHHVISVKPILFSLSCITEEITINGESFIPIQKLYELAAIQICGCIGYEVEFIGTDETGLDFGIVVRDEGGKRDGFTFDMTGGRHQFVITFDNENQQGSWRLNQIALTQKLFEWKIDVFGLIESNQAIDVTTLSTNPYS